MMAKRSFSETPGLIASRTAATAASAPAIETCRHLTSSGVLTARTARISPWQSRTSQPRFSSASACRWLQRSSPSFIEPPPCVFSRSAISSANGPAVSSSRPDTDDHTSLDGRASSIGVEHHRDMIALRIFEQHDRPFRRDEEIAGRVAQEIAEHVARAGGVALVVGIEQHDRAIAGLAHPVAQFRQPPFAQRIRVDEGRLGVGEPHAAGRVRRRRVAHAILEIDILGAVGIENDDAHGEFLVARIVSRCAFPLPSSPRKRGSRAIGRLSSLRPWIPAFAGMTKEG